MKKINENKRTKNINISAANLPKEFTIEDPRGFIREMRANFLKKARKANNLSLNEVAEQCDISEEDLSRIETGKVNEQDMTALHGLSQVYNIDYFYLLSLFKLVRHTNQADDYEYGLAAFHDPQMDSETQEEIKKLLELLKDEKAK